MLIPPEGRVFIQTGKKKSAREYPAAAAAAAAATSSYTILAAENSSFCQNHCCLIGSYSHLAVKINPQDQYCANINDITSKLEYWKEKNGFLMDCLARARK